MPNGNDKPIWGWQDPWGSVTEPPPPGWEGEVAPGPDPFQFEKKWWEEQVVPKWEEQVVPKWNQYWSEWSKAWPARIAEAFPGGAAFAPALEYWWTHRTPTTEGWKMPGEEGLPAAYYGEEEWSGALPTPRSLAEEQFAMLYKDQPPVPIPPEYKEEATTPEEVSAQYEYFKGQGLPWMLLGEGGIEIPRDEAIRIAQFNDTREVYKVYALGGGGSFEVRIELGEAITGIPRIDPLTGEENPAYRYAVQALAGEEGKTGFVAEEKAITTKAATELADLIATGATDEEIREAHDKARNDLISLYHKWGDIPELEREDLTNRAGAKIWGALPTDVRQEVQKGVEAPPREGPGFGGKLEPPPFDVEALRKEIQPYGITVLDNYPFISPITQGHLSRLSMDTIRRMAEYLSTKGMTWRDFLDISAAGMGGAGMPRQRWGTPRQWG